MSFAPTELRMAEKTIMTPTTKKIVRWLVGSRCVLNQMFERLVTYPTMPESTDATVASNAKP
jgi:hypothetical protein